MNFSGIPNKNKDCVFCKIIHDKSSEVKVLESNSFIVIKDINQISEGHMLVIPKQHWVTLLDIPDKYGIELLNLLKGVSSNLMDEKLGDGFNIVMNNLESANQIVKHAHIHVIPRNEKDGIKILS